MTGRTEIVNCLTDYSLLFQPFCLESNLTSFFLSDRHKHKSAYGPIKPVCDHSEKTYLAFFTYARVTINVPVTEEGTLCNKHIA